MSESPSRRPRDMTPEELEALPAGPWIQHERPITRADWAQGRRGRCVVTVEYPPVLASAYEPSDIICWQDSAGRTWMFGQWADGRWFKQTSALA